MKAKNYRRVVSELITGCKLGAEIGVNAGKCAEVLLKNNHHLFLYLIDPWQENRERLHHAMERLHQYKDRISILVMTSREAVDLLPQLDFAFIDGDHSYEACKQDCIHYWSKVNRKLIGHDYNKEELPGVTQAVDEFANENKLRLHLEQGNIWWFDKEGA